MAFSEGCWMGSPAVDGRHLARLSLTNTWSMDVLFHKIYTLFLTSGFSTSQVPKMPCKLHIHKLSVLSMYLLFCSLPPAKVGHHHRGQPRTTTEFFFPRWLAPRIFGDFEFAMTTFGSKASTSPSVGWGFFS